jgi:hypothetical protein
MDRSQSQRIEHRSAVRAERAGALELLLHPGRRQRRGLGTDEAYRRAIHTNAVLWKSADDVRTQPARQDEGEPQTRPTVDAADGVGSNLPQAEVVETCSWTSHLSVSVTEREDRTAQSGLEHRHYVCAASRRFRLSGGDPGLVQPVRAGMGSFHNAGYEFLFIGAGLGVETREARDFQLRPGGAIHQRAVRRTARTGTHPNQHGRTRPSAGQRVCRTTLAHGEMGRGLSEGLQQRARCNRQPENFLSVLQFRPASSVVRQSDPGCGLFRNPENNAAVRKTGHAPGRSCWRSSFRGHPGAKFSSGPGETKKDAASRRFFLMSLRRHTEIYPNESKRRPQADASTTRWMSFQLAIP